MVTGMSTLVPFIKSNCVWVYKADVGITQRPSETNGSSFPHAFVYVSTDDTHLAAYDPAAHMVVMRISVNLFCNADNAASWTATSIASFLALCVATLAKVISAAVHDNGAPQNTRWTDQLYQRVFNRALCIALAISLEVSQVTDVTLAVLGSTMLLVEWVDWDENTSTMPPHRCAGCILSPSYSVDLRWSSHWYYRQMRECACHAQPWHRGRKYPMIWLFLRSRRPARRSQCFDGGVAAEDSNWRIKYVELASVGTWPNWQWQIHAHQGPTGAVAAHSRTSSNLMEWGGGKLAHSCDARAHHPPAQMNQTMVRHKPYLL